MATGCPWWPVHPVNAVQEQMHLSFSCFTILAVVVHEHMLLCPDYWTEEVLEWQPCLLNSIFCHCRSETSGVCGLTHDGWYHSQASHSPYGPPGDHTNGSGLFAVCLLVWPGGVLFRAFGLVLKRPWVWVPIAALSDNNRPLKNCVGSRSLGHGTFVGVWPIIEHSKALDLGALGTTLSHSKTAETIVRLLGQTDVLGSKLHGNLQHLANTTEWSICGSDAAVHQIILSTCIKLSALWCDICRLHW